MAKKEATARIKINELLKQAGWRLLDSEQGPANIGLEVNVQIRKLRTADLDDWGENLEHIQKGFIDFLLLDEQGLPLIILEAKSEDKNPLVGKEQARQYARSQNCRFIILSNGNLHYFWDLERGNPYVIPKFPSPDSVEGYKKITPNPQRLIQEHVGEDYIVLTQCPNYQSQASWKNLSERPGFIKDRNLCFLRDYQLKAIHSIQKAVEQGQDRFLLEMATGTGKTMVAAAIIKLFLRSGNAHHVLFLVDRLELEDQAQKSMTQSLGNDYRTVIYKNSREDWRRAEIVITTVQSLLFDNKYQSLFSPTDFDLVISDEAHRCIGGNSRAVFDYFVGYKLGLTATPRDYLKKFDASQDHAPGEWERRVLLDTYRTFGCEDSQPTYRYSIVEGVKEGHLVNPVVVDIRTEITTQLLSEQGFTVPFTDDDGEEQQVTWQQRHFEKRFFSDATNQAFCLTFLHHALRDPINGEIGKTIIFTVSQNHAAKITQILNEMAHKMFPAAQYQSDFAVQVTSHVSQAQELARNFANNQLNGVSPVLAGYKTSKTRVCVTVGMMTTGYDCKDILNVCLFRPIFSPTDFIQIKGRGTRCYDFRTNITLEFKKYMGDDIQPQKTQFKLFDFFASYQYFEEKYDYNQVLKLPLLRTSPLLASSDQPELGNLDSEATARHPVDGYKYVGTDNVTRVQECNIGYQGMKIDRMFFEKFEETVRKDTFLQAAIESGQWNLAIEYVQREIFNKPEEYYNTEKLRRAISLDRRLLLREILEKIFGLITRFKSKDELLEEEFAKFITVYQPDGTIPILIVKDYFKAYITSDYFRHIIETRHFAELATYPPFSMNELQKVPAKYRKLIPEYIKDYVVLNQFL